MKDGRIFEKSQDPADLLMASPKGDLPELFMLKFSGVIFSPRDIRHHDSKPSSE